MQTRRAILGEHRSLRDSKKRGSRWQWRLHLEASKHEQYGWLKQIMRSKNLWHLRFNIFIQRHNCVQSGFSYLLYHLYTSRNENYPADVISYEKLDKVKNFGWKFKKERQRKISKELWISEVNSWNPQGEVLKYQPWHGSEDMPLQIKCNDIVTLCVGVRVSINWCKHTSWNLTANFYYFSWWIWM